MTPSMTLSVRHRMAKAAVAKAKEARRPDCLPGMAHRLPVRRPGAGQDTGDLHAVRVRDGVRRAAGDDHGFQQSLYARPARPDAARPQDDLLFAGLLVLIAVGGTVLMLWTVLA